MTNPRKLVLQLTLLLLIILGCVLLGAPNAHSAGLMDGFGVAAGVNGTWFQGPDTQFPAEFEAGFTPSLSLEPHITIVADVAYGFTHSYFRWCPDLRFTATNADNPDFDAFIGIAYRGGSISALQPNEWAPTAGFGWTPLPDQFRRFKVIGKVSIGLDSSQLISSAEARYAFPVGVFK